MAGRNEEKLRDTLREIGEKAQVDLSVIPIIIADVGDEKSLIKMAGQTKVSLKFN